MKVQNMMSARGREVPNQFIISEEGRGANGNFIKKEVFQSYASVIAERIYWRGEDIEGIPNAREVEITLDETYWDYSTTTGKYRNMFLGEGIEETKKKIASGEYKIANLN
jgi:hypothetical protein